MHWIDEIDLTLKENWEGQMFLWYQETLDEKRLEKKAKEAKELLLDPELPCKVETLLERDWNW